MAEIHPTPEALEQFVLGRLSSPEMREISRHLLTGCPQCQDVMACLWDPADEAEEAFALEENETLDEGVGEAYDEVLDRVFARVVAAEAAIGVQRSVGHKLFEELMQLPAARRHLLLSNSQRFRNRMLCERLIEAGHEAGLSEPAQAIEISNLATVVADRLTPEDCGGGEALNGLRARAWAQLGNSYRVNAQLAGAERALCVAQSLLEEAPVALPDRARVYSLLASFRVDQRKFAEALQLLDRAAVIYKKLGQWSLLGRTLLQKAVVCAEANDVESQMRLLRQALDLIDPQADPRVFLIARHNLIDALNMSGRSREAFALLFHTRPLYLKAGDRMSLLRLRWLEGQVALGLQRIEQAEVAFREVREGFRELGQGFDAALASLDLASVYVQQGRTADLRLLAEETLAVFQAHDSEQEMLAALLVLRDAACMDRAELQLVQEVSGFLKRARTNPELRFSPPTTAS
ncbi:MAG TPA: tetratricopeptide repeat protein [Thermoanaerobaculia bacterium]|jgi:tetratricopeptide (TPR) repeat protein